MERVRPLTHKILKFLEYVGFVILFAPLFITLLPEMISDYLRDLPRKSAQRRADRMRELFGQTRWRHGGGEQQARQGQRAWAELVAVGDAMEPSRPWKLARNLVWESWLQEPDDEGWAVLTRWREEKALTDLLAALGRPRAQGDRVALEAFCARQRLAPEQSADRVRGYVLAGQHELRRALDPDGALLAQVYWTTSPGDEARTRLRKMLLAGEDLDGMRAVVEARSGQARASAADGRDLIKLRRDLGDWDGLWHQAQHSRLVDAVAAVAAIRPGWRPDRQSSSQSSSSLFALLVGADHASLRRARSALFKSRGPAMKTLRRLANQPLATWQPKDLDIARAAAQDTDRHPAVRPLYVLLVRCLECRFSDRIPVAGRLGPVTAGKLPPVDHST
jgi:hypothetical protein